MYADPNFRTKKALKAAIEAAEDDVYIFSPGPFPAPKNGRATLEGPHYPQPHTWYAQVEVENGIIVKVIS